jgi:hypothetical protein
MAAWHPATHPLFVRLLVVSRISLWFVIYSSAMEDTPGALTDKFTGAKPGRVALFQEA